MMADRSQFRSLLRQGLTNWPAFSGWQRSAISVLALAAALGATGCGSSLQRATDAAGRAQALFAAGRYAEAIEAAQQATKLRDDVPDLWLLIARAQMAQRNFSGAFYAYTRVSELDQSNVEALRALAELNLVSKNYIASERYIDQMLALNPRDINAVLMRGFSALGRNRIEAATDAASQAEAIEPDNIGGKVLRARILLSEDRPEEGRALLEPLAQRPDASWDVLSALQMMYRAGNNGAGLENIAQRLANADPKNLQRQVDYARELYLNGKRAAAEAILVHADKNVPFSLEFENRVTELWLETETPTLVAQAMIAKNPLASPNLTAALVELAILRNDPQLALVTLKPLIASAGPLSRDNADLLALNTVVLRAAGRRDEAGSGAEQILKLDPTNAFALLAKAQLAFDRGDTNSATAAVMLLIRDNPKLAQARLLLASIYAKRGEGLLARDTLAAAAQDMPANAQIMLARSRFLVSTGQARAAIETSGEFTRKNPDSLTGWRGRGEICVQAKSPCVAEAVQRLQKLRMGEPAARAIADLASRAGLSITPERA